MDSTLLLFSLFLSFFFLCAAQSIHFPRASTNPPFVLTHLSFPTPCPSCLSCPSDCAPPPLSYSRERQREQRTRDHSHRQSADFLWFVHACSPSVPAVASMPLSFGGTLIPFCSCLPSPYHTASRPIAHRTSVFSACIRDSLPLHSVHSISRAALVLLSILPL